MFKGLKNRILKWKNRLLENRKKELIMKRNLLKEIKNIIMSKKMDEKVREKLLGNLLKLKKQKINLMVQVQQDVKRVAQ